MELTDIMALVKAGYTKDEIAQMEKPVQTEPVTPVVSEPESVPAEKPTVESVVVTPTLPVVTPSVPQEQATQEKLAEVMQAIAKLTSAIQANAISQSVMPMTTPVQAEDIMAEIIRPTYKGKE